MSLRPSHPDQVRVGLSARLLLLTVAFVMLAEVLIYAPSIARFRLDYLEDRLAAAHLAILALDATPDQMVSADLERELLAHVGAHTVALKRPERGKLMLMREHPTPVDQSYDLRQGSILGLIRDAILALAANDDRVLRVVGPSPKDPTVEVELVLDEAPLREAMIGYSNRILALSLVISLFTAALVYLSLLWLLVRPMRRITASMTAFRDDPEDASRIIQPSARRDEIGVAQRELANMQHGLRAALHQKTRLAALGIAVTKINHDLKNILATALLVSDRLLASDDPEVRRVTPTLMGAIDRAVRLCGQTLAFTREGPPPLELSRFDLGALVDDVAAGLPETTIGDAVWHNRIDRPIELRADREQLFRVLTNLARNGFEAGAKTIEVSARCEDGRVLIAVTDDGPGLPPRARERLFQPFSGSARPGGTGLGLAIARDLMHAHGGDIRLERSTAQGTSFCLILPLIAAGTGQQRQTPAASKSSRADAA
ncbi:MAG: sensor histidine kinase [Kiloniellales bacterium]